MITEEDLNFVEGQVVLALENGKILSIINFNRQIVLDQAPPIGDWLSVQADYDTWEVGQLNEFGRFVSGDIKDFSPWMIVTDGEVIYGHVPKAVVLDYINQGEVTVIQPD